MQIKVNMKEMGNHSYDYIVLHKTILLEYPVVLILPITQFQSHSIFRYLLKQHLASGYVFLF